MWKYKENYEIGTRCSTFWSTDLGQISSNGWIGRELEITVPQNTIEESLI